MKRLLSMLVVLALVLSMVPSVFATSEDGIVEDISMFEVALNADNGYYAAYTWTPSEDGELSLYQYTEKEIEVNLYQGDNFATNFLDFGDGDLYYGFATSMTVVAGEEVTIEVINAVEEEEIFNIYGEFMGAPGKDANNPIMLEDVYATVSNTGTLWYSGFFSGAEVSVTGTGDFTVNVNDEEIAAQNGVVTFDGVGTPVVFFAITGEGEFTIQATYPVGSQMNPEMLMRPAYIPVNIAEGNDQGYYYKWTAMEGGQFKLNCPAIEGVSYDVTLHNLDTYEYNSLLEGDVAAEYVAVNVAAGQTVRIWIGASMAEDGSYPAVSTALTGELLQNIGTRENPEVIFNAEEILVNIPEGDRDGYCYKWTTYADGELTITAPTVEGVEYDVILTNMTTYAMAWLSDSTNGTVSMAVANGDTVIIEIGIAPDAEWNYPALETTLAGSFTYPIGSYDNPEVLRRPNYINVDIAENAFEYYYKWTSNDAGELILTCPTVEGVDYQVVLTNLNSYDMAYSADGSVAIAVSAGDEVLINVQVLSEDFFTAPALQTALTGEFVFAAGTQMNPEALFRPSYINVNIAEGNTQGHFYKWTANADGTLILTCPTVEGVAYDVNMTNMSTYEMAWLQDSTDGTISLDVKMGDEIIIQVCAIPDANWNTPALQTALTGEFVYPIGTQMNPENLFRPSYINVNIAEGNNQGHFYKWTANADGTLVLTCPAVEGVAYDVNMTNMNTYAQAWLVDSTDGTISLEVKAGDEVVIQVCAMPDAAWNYPALQTALTGEFVYPIGTQMNPENLFRPSYINVNIAEGNTQGHFYKWTANADGTLILTCPTVEGVTYDVNMTNMSTYEMAWLQDSTDGTISLAVSAGDEIIIQVCAIPDASWNTPALQTALTGEFVYPIGTQMNPENLFRPSYINVNIAEGNTQGYYYKWTANADGTLILTCPTVEGVTYDVNMTNMSTYEMVWLQDSTDGTISLAVSAGDEIIIQVCAIPDAEWNTPALQTALTGEFVYPIGTQMNPENLFRPSYINVNIAEGNTQGYYYKWTANADGTLVLTCPAVEGVEYDVNMTNMRTYAQAWLVDSTDGTISLEVKVGDEIIIQVCAMPDAAWNYPALQTALTGEFVFPIGTQMNPEILFRPNYINVNIAEGNNQGYFYKWTANADGTLVLTCPAVEGVEYDVNMTNMRTYAQAWLVDSTDGTISLEVKAGDEIIIQVCAMPDAAWNYPALQTALTGEFVFPIGTQMNPEILARPEFINVNIAEGNNQGYFYKWTADVDGTLVLTCPAVEGVEYDVNMTNMSTYAQAWLVDSTDGTISLEVKAGDEVVIQVCAMPDAAWNYPALQITLTGEFKVGGAAITAQPQNITVNSGEKAQFTVETTGEVVSYKWQYRKVHVWFDTEMTGYNTATLTVPAVGSRNGYDYRCVVTFADGTQIISEPAEMTVITQINITSNPNDQLVSLGYKGQFTVKAEGEGLKYQWEYRRPGGERWNETSMDGATNETVMIETDASRDGYQYRCRITDAAGTVAYSEIATMTVLSFTQNPADVRTSAGTNVTFSVATSKEPLKYQWQYSRNNGATWNDTGMPGYNTATLTVEATAARNGYLYRCVVTGSKASTVTSKSATLNIGAAAEITVQPESKTAQVGTEAKFTVEADNVLSYQWQYTKNGKDWYTTTMTGANTAELTVAVIASRNGYQYRCQITATNGDVIYTEAATLTVG